MEQIKKKRMKNPRLQRLSVDISVEMHSQLLEIAKIRNATLANIVRGTLEVYIISEKELYG
jgi:hypothetical protein